MKAVWIAERNMDTAMGALVRARAIIRDEEEEDELDPLEREPGSHEKAQSED
jgi:hypothetical protein